MRTHFSRSLSAHLREAEDHSSLPFHPDCPICRRYRLAGSLEGEELLSRRTQAAIAAGLIAFSAGGAPAAFGSPPDEVSEGTEEVVSSGDRSTSVDFEPDGETDQLPDVVSPSPVAPAPVTDDEDAGPLEQEPATDASELPAEGDADQTTDRAATAQEPITAEPITAEPIPAGPAPSASTPAPAVTADPTRPPTSTSTADHGPKPEAGQRHRTLRHEVSEAAAPAEPPSVSTRSSDIAVAPAAAPVALQPVETAAEESVTTRVVAHRSAGRAGESDRFHTVQHGESLWSIAADVLGEDAGVARIAREVDRLWKLNEERIGTGQPDLLFAGTRLRLR